jgi:hypothetical protein
MLVVRLAATMRGSASRDGARRQRDLRAPPSCSCPWDCDRDDNQRRGQSCANDVSHHGSTSLQFDSSIGSAGVPSRLIKPVNLCKCGNQFRRRNSIERCNKSSSSFCLTSMTTSSFASFSGHCLGDKGFEMETGMMSGEYYVLALPFPRAST